LKFKTEFIGSVSVGRYIKKALP